MSLSDFAGKDDAFNNLKARALTAESKLARLEAAVREYFAAQRDNRGSATDAMRMMDARTALDGILTP